MNPARIPAERRRLLAGTFLISAAALALELALTRLLSVITWYHLAYFSLSAALLGLTSGAVAIHRAGGNSRPERDCRRFALSLPVALALMCRLDFGPPDAFGDPAALLLTALLGWGPFHFAGRALAAAIARGRAEPGSGPTVGTIYASDLFGAAAGCLSALAGLERLDAPGVILACALAGATAAWAYGGRRRDLATAAALVLILAVHARQPIAPFRPTTVKGVPERAGEILVERWNSISRVTVGTGRRVPPILWGASPSAPTGPVLLYPMAIDGFAGTFLCADEPGREPEYLRFDVTGAAFHLRSTGEACVVGVGAGRDVRCALLAGFGRVTALDVNGIFVEFLEGPFRDAAGIAGRREVRLVVDEARSFLARDPRRYSVLQMSLVDTWAATGAGAFSLTENGLYTVEAWRLFLDRLAGDGILSVSRWYDPVELGETGRLVGLAVAALVGRGVARPADHVALLCAERIATLLVFREPAAPADLARLGDWADRLGFRLVIRPGKVPDDPRLAAIVSSRDLPELRERLEPSPYDLEPPTDDRPFFFQMLKGGHWDRLRTAGPGLVRGNLFALATLSLLTLALLAVALTTVFLPLLADARGGGRHLPPSGVAYFCAIGAGFMAVETGLLQTLSLFLGHPMHSLGILLFALILGAGCGSLLADRVRPACGAAAAVAAAASLVAAPPMLRAVTVRFLESPLAVRAGMAILAAAPLGMLLGLFFPLGLRAAARRGFGGAAWCLALNGVFGTLFSALALLVSLKFGIATNFRLAAALYLSAAPFLAAKEGRDEAGR